MDKAHTLDAMPIVNIYGFITTPLPARRSRPQPDVPGLSAGLTDRPDSRRFHETDRGNATHGIDLHGCAPSQ